MVFARGPHAGGVARGGLAERTMCDASLVCATPFWSVIFKGIREGEGWSRLTI